MEGISAFLDQVPGSGPRGVVLGWTPEIATLHLVSGILIGTAAFALTIAIAYFVSRRSDLAPPARRAAYLFATLLTAIGITQVLGLAAIWWPIEGTYGLAKAAAAGVSVFTAILVWPLLPKLLGLPSPARLERANAQLQSEIVAHLETLKQLNEARAELERKVAQRTRELAETNQRFETALTGSDITVFTQDRDLRYTWIYNPRFASDPHAVVGLTDEEYLPQHAVAEIVAAKRAVIDSGRSRSLAVTVPTESEGTLYLALSIDPVIDADGHVEGLTCAVVDLTERHDYETRLAALSANLEEANVRFDLALRGSNIMAFSTDAALRYVWLHNPLHGVDPAGLIGRTDAEIWPGDGAAALTALKEAAVAGAGRQHDEVTLMLGERRRYFDVTVEPVTDEAGAIVGLAGAAVDLTERKQHEEHMRLVMRELTHRSKNLLAVIQAMARQTASRAEDPQTFVHRFSSRLRAMATSHDLLVAQEWHGAGLEELVAAQLAQAVDLDSDRIAYGGPTISLKPDAAQNVGLALHELTTNASKYGALSVEDGMIRVEWDFAEDQLFRLRWSETGGPAVEPPTRRGFGLVLLERTVGQSLDGRVDLDFQAGGLVCDITFPDRHVLRFDEPVRLDDRGAA